MVKYIFRRLAYMVLVFFIVTIVVFLVFKAVPTDPTSIYLEGSASSMSPEKLAQMREQIIKKHGLDRPLAIQYLYWVRGLISGDFGYSMFYKMPVKQVLATPIKNTVKLNIINLVIVFSITIPLGIRSAVRRGKLFDNVTQVITILGYSLPTFITAVLAILLFTIILGLLPMFGTETIPFRPPQIFGTTFLPFLGFLKSINDPIMRSLDKAKYMVMPLMVMTFTSLGGLTRYVRAAMIEALNLDCIRTARAKGLREKTVIYSHAMRNAQITVITVMANWFIGIFGGSLVIEKAFNWQGMGKVMYDAVMNQDYGLAFAMNMFYVIIALVGHLIVDLLYAAADPRIRLT